MTTLEPSSEGASNLTPLHFRVDVGMCTRWEPLRLETHEVAGLAEQAPEGTERRWASCNEVETSLPLENRPILQSFCRPDGDSGVSSRKLLSLSFIPDRFNLRWPREWPIDLAVSLVARRDKSAACLSYLIASVLGSPPLSISLSRSAWNACKMVIVYSLTCS